MLLFAGANPNKSYLPYYTTPLDIAVNNNNLDVAKILLLSGADAKQTRCGKSILCTAVEKNNYAMINLLLNFHIDVDQIKLPDHVTGLFVAVENNNFEMVTTLLTAKSNPNIPCKDTGTTPLLVAVEHGKLKIILALLKAKADVNQERKNDGMTPLLQAIKMGRYDIVKVLLEAGAYPNMTAYHDNTSPLLLAVSMADEPMTNLMLHHKADYDHSTVDGNTPLLTAVLLNNLSLVRSLILAGASPFKVLKNNMNAIHFARENGYKEIIDYFTFYLNSKAVRMCVMPIQFWNKKSNKNPLIIKESCCKHNKI
jgi:ankyrin repeat protein